MPTEQPAFPEPPPIRLDQFLQLCGIAMTGGQAKLLIQGGEVQVNGVTETRRRRKVVAEDVVRFEGTDYRCSEFLGES